MEKYKIGEQVFLLGLNHLGVADNDLTRVNADRSINPGIVTKIGYKYVTVEVEYLTCDVAKRFYIHNGMQEPKKSNLIILKLFKSRQAIYDEIDDIERKRIVKIVKEK